jgi:phosphoribosylformylglycinamidine (FGAM) synthase PurS component
MPSNTSITIKDGASTPVDHVFSPTRIDANNIATFQERVSGVPIGYPTITWSLRAPTKGSSTYKVTGKLTQPKVIDVTDTSGKTVKTVDYVNLATVDFVFSEKSTKQERKDLRTLMSNLLINAVMAASADDLESFW